MRGPHRERARVPGVVDEQAAARERHLLAAPARQLDVPGAHVRLVERQPERLVGEQRGERVVGVVARADAELERHPAAEHLGGESRAVVERLPGDDLGVAGEAADGQARGDERVELGRGRDDGGGAGRQRLEQLRLRAGHALERADQLEVRRRDRRDHADVRPRDVAERRDLAEAAHGQLQHADLGVRLESGERERDAELGVEARLGRDGARVRAAERGQDVLGRGLADGAR